VGVTALAAAALAEDYDSWLLRVGVQTVQPQSHNHQQLNVGNGTALTMSGTYLFAREWGVELLAALPVEHDIGITGRGKVAEIKHLPPTLSVQRHFYDRSGRARAYVGVGLNYTVFLDERTTGALAGTQLDLHSSVGPAAQVGLDLHRRSMVHQHRRPLVRIDSDATLNGASIGAVEIDPYAFGPSIGRSFR
jgi:outer membrane protein